MHLRGTNNALTLLCWNALVQVDFLLGCFELMVNYHREKTLIPHHLNYSVCLERRALDDDAKLNVVLQHLR